MLWRSFLLRNLRSTGTWRPDFFSPSFPVAQQCIDVNSPRCWPWVLQRGCRCQGYLQRHAQLRCQLRVAHHHQQSALRGTRRSNDASAFAAPRSGCQKPAGSRSMPSAIWGSLFVSATVPPMEWAELNERHDKGSTLR